MVRIPAMPGSTIAVTVEHVGGIENLACQDDHGETCYQQEKQQNQNSIERPTALTNKSTELLTVQSTERLEVGQGVISTVDPTATNPGSQGAREKIMNICRSFWHWRLLINAVIVVAVVLFMAVIELGVLPHQQIGFYCNDPKISFPFTGETITTSMLLGGSVLIPLLVIWASEWTCHKSDSYRDLKPGCTGTRSKQIWSWYGHYTIGIVALTCVCDFIKILIGEPRPHFLNTCKPREWENCTEGSTYIPSYTCTNEDQPFWFVMDASKSFPSGHSALSMFTSIYLIWYLQNRLPRRTTSILLKPWMQCVVLCWGIVCSSTRITDNRHHWWDVLAGVFIGICAGIYCVRVNCKGFILKDIATGWTGEPIENGHHGYDSRRHQSVRKLLSNTSVEHREMGDVTTTWKE